ncbi:MAG: GlcG/HbpS family heme-binding protein [Methylomicrobium sp.]
MKKRLSILASIGLAVVCSNSAFANPNSNIAACKDLPTWSQLKSAIDSSGATDKNENGGFGLNMWATVVNRDGVVCNVAFTGGDRGAQWPGSRVISAAKAYTANAYSLPGLALSTANLYASGQPGGSLWGLQFSNPVNPDLIAGNASRFGQHNDPMINKKVAGQIVFGGGFALYNKAGQLVGGLGVSGDTSCKDHNFGWRVRHALNLDFIPAGVNSNDPTRPDNIIYDMGLASKGLVTSPSGFGHTDCGLGENAISLTLPAAQK